MASSTRIRKALGAKLHRSLLVGDTGASRNNTTVVLCVMGLSLLRNQRLGGGLLPVGSALSSYNGTPMGTPVIGNLDLLPVLVTTKPCGCKIRLRLCQVAWKAAGVPELRFSIGTAIKTPKPC